MRVPGRDANRGDAGALHKPIGRGTPPTKHALGAPLRTAEQRRRLGRSRGGQEPDRLAALRTASASDGDVAGLVAGSNDMLKAVGEFEKVLQTARWVLGNSHPVTKDITNDKEKAKKLTLDVDDATMTDFLGLLGADPRGLSAADRELRREVRADLGRHGS